MIEIKIKKVFVMLGKIKVLTVDERVHYNELHC